MRAVLSSDPATAAEQLQRLYWLLDEKRVEERPGPDWQWDARDELWTHRGGIKAFSAQVEARGRELAQLRGWTPQTPAAPLPAQPAVVAAGHAERGAAQSEGWDSPANPPPSPSRAPPSGPVWGPGASVGDASRAAQDAPESANEALAGWIGASAVELAADAFAELIFDLSAQVRSLVARQAGAAPGYLEHGSGISGTSSPDPVEPTRGPVRNCLEGRWQVFRCPDGHKQAFWTGCMRLDCERCIDAVAAQRSSRVWEDCGDLTDTWGVAVLTVPADMAALITSDMRSKLRRLAWETTDYWLRSVGHVEGALGAAVWFHPVGSVYVCPRAREATLRGEEMTDHPCNSTRRKRTHEQSDEGALRCSHCASRLVSVDDEKWHPHWNVMLPLVARGTLDDEDEAARVGHWMDNRTGALDALRRIWARSLADFLGVPSPSSINVFWEYRKGPMKIRHALRYFARSFPGWSAWTTCAGGNRYGELANVRVEHFRECVQKSLGLVERPPSEHLCNQCQQPMKFLGLTSPSAWRYLPGGIVPPDPPHYARQQVH